MSKKRRTWIPGGDWEAVVLDEGWLKGERIVIVAGEGVAGETIARIEQPVADYAGDIGDLIAMAVNACLMADRKNPWRAAREFMRLAKTPEPWISVSYPAEEGDKGGR